MAKTNKKDQQDAGKSSIQQTIEKLNKDFGPGTILALGEKPHGDYEVISTGSLGLDHALGIWGVALGKLYELMGWEGTGKSTLCGHLVANAQKTFPNKKVVYIDGEHAVDTQYFQALGVDIDSLLICQPTTGEEGFTVADRMVKTGEVSLVIIDSDSSLLPKAVVEGEVGESAIGKKARLNNQMYPKLKTAISDHNVAMVVVSQYREKIGVMFGNPTTTQGGHALKFYADVRLEISRNGANKDGDVQVGNKAKAKALKNKMAPPFQLAEFDIVFGKGIDRTGEVLDMGVELGIIEKSGSWYSCDGNKLGQGRDGVIEMLDDNEDFRQDLENKVITALKEGATVQQKEEEKVA